MGPSSQGGESFFLPGRTSLRAKVQLVGPSSQGGNIFFAKYCGPSDGSPLSGGGIIIFRVIRRHFLAAAMDPVVSLSMYSRRLMEVVP